jgi:hypothetical protein
MVFYAGFVGGSLLHLTDWSQPILLKTLLA